MISKPIREAFELRPGETVRFAIEDGRIVIRGNEDALEAFLEASGKRPEPTHIDRGETYGGRFAAP